MNFLRGLRSKAREARITFQHNYLRNSDSNALKSSEFKSIMPFVREFVQFIFIVSEKDNTYTERSLRREVGWRFRFPIF